MVDQQPMDDPRAHGFGPVAEDEPLSFDAQASPRAAGGVYVAPSAVVTGDVVLGQGASVWHNAVVRGDIDYIRIGRHSNVQDGAVIHVTGGVYPVRIGERVSLAHGAMVHGCVIEDDCLIGIGAIVLDNATVGRGSLVAAGCVVPEGMTVPPGSLVAGLPGRVRGPLDDSQRQLVSRITARYLEHTTKALRGEI
jgi:carbonic anhydrase/acetyltransferase-like protein (isoleucine patch superfamily)